MLTNTGLHVVYPIQSALVFLVLILRKSKVATQYFPLLRNDEHRGHG